MTKTKNIHMVPQVVIDCGENVFKSGRVDDLYLLRIEAIRDYCNHVVSKYEAARNKTDKAAAPKKRVQSN